MLCNRYSHQPYHYQLVVKYHQVKYLLGYQNDFLFRYIYSSRFKVNRCAAVFFAVTSTGPFSTSSSLTLTSSISSSVGTSILVRVLLGVLYLYLPFILLCICNIIFQVFQPCGLGPDSGGGLAIQLYLLFVLLFVYFISHLSSNSF